MTDPRPAPDSPPVDALRDTLDRSGLDLVASFDTAWLDEDSNGRRSLPNLGRESAHGLLVGNTRAIWAPFVDAVREQPERLRQPDPLDTWVEERVRAALDVFSCDVSIAWGHRRTDAGAFPPLQWLAELAGLAARAPSGLCIHPTYGPWIALRAAVVLDVDGPQGPPPSVERPCRPCDPECERALEHALDGTDPDAEGDPTEDDWRAWVAVRDACPVGAEHRYNEAQIRYHYTGDREILARAAGLSSDGTPDLPPRSTS